MKLKKLNHPTEFIEPHLARGMPAGEIVDDAEINSFCDTIAHLTGRPFQSLLAP